MNRVGIVFSLSALLAFLPGAQVPAKAEAGAAPDFQQAYELIRKNLAGVNESEFNRMAVEGLISGFSPRVRLVKQGAEPTALKEPVAGEKVFSGSVGYVRIAQVDKGLGGALGEALGRLRATNRLEGLVLDLRYAAGDNFASASEAAQLFVRKAQPLLDWGEGVVHSKTNEQAFGEPVAVLVNAETAGAAEALAAVLRDAGVALIFGNRTAGRAMVTRDFPLSNGDLLRISVAPLKLGSGAELGAAGLEPDITVAVRAADEQLYYQDAYRLILRTNQQAAGGTLAATSTNRPSRKVRFGEAELVRERQEGIAPESEAAAGGEPAEPTVNDPVLARAIDVIKGLAVVRQRP
jgi:C-terminal processing protease CtpA/Prc